MSLRARHPLSYAETDESYGGQAMSQMCKEPMSVPLTLSFCCKRLRSTLEPT